MKEQCPRCLKWFKDILKHKVCQGIKQDTSGDYYEIEETYCAIPENMTPEARMELGWAMLSDDYTD